MSSAFALEVIPSKSGVEAQISSHRATLPFLEGTKPPVTLPTVKPEDSFLGATIEELTAFVVQKLRPKYDDVFPPEYLSEAHFFILDAKTFREGSMILVNIRDADYDEESESEVEEDDDESTRRMRLAGEMVKMKFGKKSLTKAYLFGQQGDVQDEEEENEESEGKFKINAVRIGLAIIGYWAQTIERTSCDIDVMKMGCANDGVYWGPSFRGQDLPPMEERPGMNKL